VFQSRADLLTHNLKLACSKLGQRSGLYLTEIEAVTCLAADVIQQLQEVCDANQV
jgi:hypothetical protein